MTIYRVAVRTRVNTDNYINVFHLSSTTTSPSAVAINWGTACGAAFEDCIPTSATLEDVTATDLTNLTQYVHTIGVAGQVVGDMCPPQAAAVITWRTAQVGRKYRGRTFMPCVGEAHQSGGTLDVTYTSNLSTLATAIMTAWPTAVTGALILYHKGSGTGTSITSFTVRDTVFTQRRRTLGQGS